MGKTLVVSGEPARYGLTTHAGSLPRPTALDDALDQRGSDEAAYAATLRSSVADVVGRQVEAGVDVVNDGEFGKSSWTGYLTERLGGFESRPVPPGQAVLRGKDFVDFGEFYAEAARTGTMWYRPGRASADSTAPVQWVCAGPITYTGQAALQKDIDNVLNALQGFNVPAEEAFLPVAAPASVEPNRLNEHYASEEAYVYALAEALKTEYDTIVGAGLLLQVDDAFIPYNYDRFVVDGMSMQDYMKHCHLRVEALNHALRDIPEDRVRYHICWGSWHGPHSNDVPLKDIVDLVLRVKAQAYLFEAANVRHEHEYHVWDDVRAARWQDSRPGGRFTRDQRAGTPGVRRRATATLRRPRRAGERDGRHGLWPGWTRPSAAGVGQAAGAGRRGRTGGLVGSRGAAAYIASKHGVVGLTKAAALECAPHGIRVNAVCPGFVQTPMLERLTAGDAEREAALSARTPVGRLAQPDEIASSAVWLCSDAASYITGHALAIDGGYIAQ